MLIPITSRDNKTVKLVRALERKKERVKRGLYFAEGVRLVKEAVRDAEEDIQFILVSSSFAEKNEFFINSLDESGKTVYTAKDVIFQSMCRTETPQGIGAVLKMRPTQNQWMGTERYILLIDGVSDPGNLGTMIRTAEAAGVDKVCIFEGSADLYNPKTVRATMGSLFRVPFWIGSAEEIFPELKRLGFQIFAAALHHSVPAETVEIPSKRAVIIGSEARGVSETVLQMADTCVRIDMKGRVESLNASVAAGILLYQFK